MWWRKSHDRRDEPPSIPEESAMSRGPLVLILSLVLAAVGCQPQVVVVTVPIPTPTTPDKSTPTNTASAVPPETELARLRKEIATLDADELKTKNDLAKQIVEKERLDREVNRLRSAVKDELVAEPHKGLTAALEATEKRAEMTADKVKVLGEQLSAIQSIRQELLTEADKLEVNLRLLDPSKPLEADGRKLAELREEIEKLKDKVAERRERLKLDDPPPEKPGK